MQVTIFSVFNMMCGVVHIMAADSRPGLIAANRGGQATIAGLNVAGGAVQATTSGLNITTVLGRPSAPNSTAGLIAANGGGQATIAGIVADGAGQLTTSGLNTTTFLGWPSATNSTAGLIAANGAGQATIAGLIAAGGAVQATTSGLNTATVLGSPSATNSTACGANQTFAEAGVNCTTCSKPDGPCPMNLNPGCYCNGGYGWAGSRCILPEECTPADKCEENESYSPRGFDCFTCHNYTNNTCKITNVKKCYCNHGYVSDDNKRCVKFTECKN